MKKKIIKSIALSMGCLMLTLTLSSGFINNSTKVSVHTNQDSPYA